MLDRYVVAAGVAICSARRVTRSVPPLLGAQFCLLYLLLLIAAASSPLSASPLVV